MKVNDCCGESPALWKCDCNATSFCGCDVEKIECYQCGRIIYGADDENIKEWNDGLCDYETLQ